ncbi:MAG: hypothetical protein QW035_02225 [Candidatus Anstonellales archaeon]
MVEKQIQNLDKVVEGRTNASKIMLTKEQAIESTRLFADRVGYTNLDKVQEEVEKAFKNRSKISLAELIAITDSSTGGRISEVIKILEEAATRIENGRKLYFNGEAGKGAMNICIHVLIETGVLRPEMIGDKITQTEKGYVLEPGDSMSSKKFMNNALEQLFYRPGAEKHLYAGARFSRAAKKILRLTPTKTVYGGVGVQTVVNDKGELQHSLSASISGQTEKSGSTYAGLAITKNSAIEFRRDIYGLSISKNPALSLGPIYWGSGGASLGLGFASIGKQGASFADPIIVGVMAMLDAYGTYKERIAEKKSKGEILSNGDYVKSFADEFILKLPIHLARTVYNSMKSATYQLSELWYTVFYPRKGYKFEVDENGRMTQDGIKSLYKKIDSLHKAMANGQRHKAKAIAEKLAKSNAPPEIVGYALAMSHVIDGDPKVIGKTAKDMHQIAEMDPTTDEGRKAVGYLSAVNMLKERSYFIDSKELAEYKEVVNSRVSVAASMLGITTNDEKIIKEKVQEAIKKKDPTVLFNLILLINFGDPWQQQLAFNQLNEFRKELKSQQGKA